jgi:hypothetical protein
MIDSLLILYHNANLERHRSVPAGINFFSE